MLVSGSNLESCYIIEWSKHVSCCWDYSCGQYNTLKRTDSLSVWPVNHRFCYLFWVRFCLLCIHRVQYMCLYDEIGHDKTNTFSLHFFSFVKMNVGQFGLNHWGSFRIIWIVSILLFGLDLFCSGFEVFWGYNVCCALYCYLPLFFICYFLLLLTSDQFLV